MLVTNFKIYVLHDRRFKLVRTFTPPPKKLAAAANGSASNDAPEIPRRDRRVSLGHLADDLDRLDGVTMGFVVAEDCPVPMFH